MTTQGIHKPTTSGVAALVKIPFSKLRKLRHGQKKQITHGIC